MRLSKPNTTAERSCQATASDLQVHLLTAKDRPRFELLLKEHHYLGNPHPVGDQLGQVVTRDGQWVA